MKVDSMKTGQSERSEYALPNVLLVIALLMCILHAGQSRADNPPLRIGVLAIRGIDQCLQSWAPTADYLSRQVSGQRFVIVPLTHNQIYYMVENGGVDFILSNSAMYVGLEYWYRANRIVTLKERRASGVYTRYGGVIFCRRDRLDIRGLEDLKGKSFMAVSEASLGGWLMAWRELKEKSIDPYHDFSDLRFNETHDEVVYAVRDRLVDAGTVRTNTLEDLSAEGKIDLADFYVFPRIHAEDGPTSYFCTTREYPAWPMAKVRHTPDDLTEKVAVALLQMPPDSSPALAAGCSGWTIPLNYQPVHDCMKILKVGPYKDLGKITVGDVLKTYGHWIIFACAAFCILTAFTVVIMKLNRRIRTSNVRLQVEMDLRRQKDSELKTAKELAEAATRAKSEFLANMSHEIRTPMNGVIAATDLALGEKVPPKVDNYLKIIQTSAYSLLGIINDILDFSKIEAGKFELKPRIFRLSEVFDRVMELFFSKAAEKGIELLVDCDPDTPKVLEGDPLRLQQILTNLISNAIKFTESGGVILISVNPSMVPVDDIADDRVTLSFSVKDTGTGIAPKYRDLLFEPFSQADTSSTRKYEGTGLGLSICKQLVTMMGGEIGVDSETGRGSTFFFSVRLKRPPLKPLAKPVIPPDIQGLNILVVDDLADSRLIMRKMLESLGFKVETLSSGPDALNRLKDNQLRNNPIELIMMDWKMPQMDGIEVSKKIRQEMKLTMPIIMMTAFGKEEQRIQAEKVGINGFLVKPIYPSTLFDAIMDGFGKSGTRETNRKKHFTTRASIYRKPLRGLHMLVAEDNPTNQQVAQAILEGAGIVAMIVNNGEEAVAAVRDHTFDAVLMDIQMPKMNGYEATRLIRKLPQGNSIPIVAMTAHAMKGDEEKCLEVGMDGYISKPVNQDRLFHTLWRLLRSSRGAFEELLSEDERAFADMAAEDDAVTDTSLACESSDTGLPDTMPGLNIKDTLAALNIDGTTLARIMVGFLDGNQQTVHQLQKALIDNDLDTLRQLAHSLKGSSANIGANDLSVAAYALEDACRRAAAGDGGREEFAPLIENVAKALDLVLCSIRTLKMPVPDKQAPVENATADSLEGLLAALTDAIDKADPEAIEALLPVFKQQARPSGQVDPSMLVNLEAQIGRYDYDQALETIQKINRK